MHKVKKFICQLVFILVSTVFFSYLILYYEHSKNLIKNEAFVLAKDEYISDTHFELILWNMTATSNPNNQIVIKWWYSPTDDKYYLFLPQALSESEMYWMFNPNAQVAINTMPIESGSLFKLDEGSYQVSVTQSQNTTVYNMDIRYSSNIGSLFLETDSRSLAYIHEAKEHEESGSYLLLSGTNSNSMYYSGEVESIHCRGNVSWRDTNKKSYQIKLTEANNLLEMGEDKHWLLLANAFDNTLLRNVIAFDIAKELELAYTPDVQFVDVYANGEYIGIYLLTEKIEIGDNRVDIHDLEEETELLNPTLPLNECEFFMEQQGRLFSTKGYRIPQQPEDITGGYILELEMSDRYGLEASGYITSRMQAVVFTSPKYASYEQVSYIASRYQDFEDAVYSENGYSPYTGAHFSDYIDMNSFARKYILEELLKNLDASYTSQFIYKYSDSISTKFFAGPAWDYDKSIGIPLATGEGVDLGDPTGLYASVYKKDSDIWYGLYQQPQFKKLVIDIYNEELEQRLRFITQDRISQYTELLVDSAINNSVRWQIFSELTIDDREDAYKAHVAKLSNFLNQRLDYFNHEWSVQN